MKIDRLLEPKKTKPIKANFEVPRTHQSGGVDMAGLNKSGLEDM